MCNFTTMKAKDLTNRSLIDQAHFGSFIIHKEQNMIIEKHNGTLLADSLIKFLIKKELNTDFSKNFNYLIDLRNSFFTKRTDKIQELIVHISKNHNYLFNNKIAFITQTNEQYAMASIFKMLSPTNPKNIHIFNYIDEAAIWLNSKLKIDDLNNIICSLTPSS